MTISGALAQKMAVCTVMIIGFPGHCRRPHAFAEQRHGVVKPGNAPVAADAAKSWGRQQAVMRSDAPTTAGFEWCNADVDGNA